MISQRHFRHGKFRKLQTVGGYLNSPISVTLVGGIIVLLISACVQANYWKYQQEYLLRQTKRSHKIETASATEADVIRAIGRRITGVAVLIAAHEQHFDHRQYIKELRAYGNSRDEWDNLEQVLSLKVNIFYDEKINRNWNNLLAEFLDLDTKVIFELEEWDTESVKKEHLNLTTQSRDMLKKITDHLHQIASQMNRYIEQIEDSR